MYGRSSMQPSDFTLALERIKEKVHLSKIVMQDTQLQKKGREYVGNCPFHLEKTGSFFVNDDKGTFYCFGCGASGDIFEYLMRKRGMQFMQIAEYLSELAGIKLPEKNVHVDNHKTLKNILQKILEFYKASLKSDEAAMKYCENRGLDKETINSFHIGFAPQNYLDLLKNLKSQGFDESDIIQTGAFYKNNRDKLVARFRERLIFPVFDKSGWPIAFGGRSISKDNLPKYINSPETLLFQKRETLYAYGQSSKNVSIHNPFIIVEGYMDVVIMHKFGFKTSIASMGTAMSAEHLAKIWKYSNDPIICMDGDNAGHGAMLKIATLALSYIQPGKSLKFAKLPDGEDPDSVLRNLGVSKMTEILRNSKYLIDFLWDHWLFEFENIDSKTPEKISAWKKDILGLISNIQDIDIRRLYNEEIKNRIYFLLRKDNRSKKNVTKNQQLDFSIDTNDKKMLRETMLLGILIMRPSVIPTVIEELAVVEFTKSGFNELRDYIIASPDTVSFKDFYSSDIINSITKTTSKNCNLSGLDDVEVNGLWNNIYEIGVSKHLQVQDFQMAKQDCSQNMDNSTWERLRALKFDLIKKKNNI